MSSARRPQRRGVVVTATGVAAAAALLGAAVPAGAEDPAVLYMLHCQGCHLPDGRGSPGSVPSLVDSVARFTAVPGGRAYLVQVPGSASSRLDDAELAAVLDWMIHRFGPAADARRAAPYTAAEVARHRGTPLTEVEGTRRRLLASMQARTPSEGR